MEGRYSKISLPDGTVKRVSKKIIQKAGGPTRATDDIDRDFASSEPRMGLVWSDENGWQRSSPSWYDMLDISPEYLTEKCGADDKPEMRQFIHNWGNSVFDINSPAPTGKAAELKERRRDKDIPVAVKSAHEQYLNTVVKETEKKAYQECKLGYRESSLSKVNKLLCEDFMCNPTPYDKPIDREEVLEDALKSDHVPAEKKDRMSACYRSGNACIVSPNYPSEYKTAMFTHIQNSGSGDCLFIAFSNYLSIVNDQLGGIFPDPMADNTGLPHIKMPIDDVKKAHEYRMGAVTWLRDNLDFILPNHQSVKNELALAAVDTDPMINVVSVSDKRRIWTDFSSTHQTEAGQLGFKTVNEILVAFSDVDGFLDSHPKTEAALDMLLKVYALAYLDSMSKRTTYGGQPEITALALVNQVNILVLQQDGGKLKHNSGYTKTRDPRGVVYIYHTRSVKGSSGGLHFEIMFPNPPAIKLKDAIELKDAPEPVSRVPVRSFNSKDRSLFVKLGFRVAAPTVASVNKFLKNAPVDSILNILLENKMHDLDAVSEQTKDILYQYIDQNAPDKYLLRIPALILRSVEKDIENWEDTTRHDVRLHNIFVKRVTGLFSEVSQMASKIPIPATQETSISGRLRYALARYLNDPENPVEPDDLLSMTITELYDIANKLEESPESLVVQAFFFTEFMENFFFMTAPLVAILSKTDVPMPGVNKKLDLQSIIDIIDIFNDYVNLEDN